MLVQNKQINRCNGKIQNLVVFLILFTYNGMERCIYFTAMFNTFWIYLDHIFYDPCHVALVIIPVTQNFYFWYIHPCQDTTLSCIFSLGLTLPLTPFSFSIVITYFSCSSSSWCTQRMWIALFWCE